MPTIYERYYESQPGVVKIILVGAAAFLGYKLYKNISNAQDEREANRAGEQAVSELHQLAQQGITPTMSASQFEVLSQTIVTAIDGCGTDEDSIFSVFSSLRNEADIRQLIATFGIRYTQPCSITSPISYALWLTDDKSFGGSLATFLRYDLSDSDMSHINSILRSRGITYQF